MEGAEAIDPNFELLDVLYEAGLRSLGPVWSRSNAFGHGVPFRCPSLSATVSPPAILGLRIMDGEHRVGSFVGHSVLVVAFSVAALGIVGMLFDSVRIVMTEWESINS